MVSGILAYKFGAPFAWITSLSVAAYVAFTLSVTQVANFLPIIYSYMITFCLVWCMDNWCIWFMLFFFVMFISLSWLMCCFSFFVIGIFHFLCFNMQNYQLRFFFSVQWRTKFRKAMNKADNDASTRAVDSLINYEVRLWYIIWLLFCLSLMCSFL